MGARQRAGRGDSGRELSAGHPGVPHRNSLPLRYADERYALGGATPAESYLNIEKLVHAALETGCDAVHPGYGFLSEESSFVKACEENGLNFIGPTSNALEKLGNKLSA